ncbi:MAG: ABC transporter substrate-binding protein [Brevinema sp.]
MAKKLTSLFLFLVLTISCGSSSNAGKQNLVVGVRTEAVTLYPFGSNDNATARVTVQIFDRLVEKDEKGTFLPSLATEWSFVSPSILQMKIRQGVLFHNDELLTVEDVKFSLETMIQAPEVKNIASPMREVKIVDDSTVQIILHEPFAPILSHLAHPTAAILNKNSIIAAGKDLKQMIPVGTGPFKYQVWNRGQNLILEKFDAYWGTPAQISTIEFRVIPEDSARTIALESGDIDLAYDIPSADLDAVRGNGSLQLIEKAIPRIEYLGINIGKAKSPILKDARVRKAIALAIDSQGIIQSVLFGSGALSSSIITDSVVGFNKNLSPIVRNVEEAKNLLKEAGVPEGTKLTLWATEGERQKIAEIIKANLREIGLDVTIAIYEWGRFLDGTANGEQDLSLMGWTTITGDADYGIYNLVHSNSFGATGNRSFYSNAKVDQLLELARREGNPSTRDAYYGQIQEILMTELPIIPIFSKVANIGMVKGLKGFVFHIGDAHQLRTIVFE